MAAPKEVPRFLGRRIALATALATSAVVVLYSAKRATDYEMSLKKKYPSADFEASAIRLFCAVPTRIMSTTAGHLSNIVVLESFRPTFYSAWAKLVGADLTEIENPNLAASPTLGDFFVRRLRKEARPVAYDPRYVTSPADGTVTFFGQVSGRLTEQIKGSYYDLNAFVGESDEKNLVAVSNETKLYQCVIYLSPKDYHRFHSPINWSIQVRRHFPGELLTVQPGIVRIVNNLFVFNERVALLGQWKHGFFCFVAVGATNVGSITLSVDPELKTNVHQANLDGSFEEKDLNKMEITKGAELGAFRLGSTVVLLFEAPADFQFTIHEGQNVHVGEPIGILPVP